MNAQLSFNNVTFSAAQLIPNRHYNVSVRASNVIGTAMSYVTISKWSLLYLIALANHLLTGHQKRL